MSLEDRLDGHGIKFNPTRQGNQPIQCPAKGHDDGNASASLNLGKGLWNCFACGAGGSEVDLIMELEGVPLRAALRIAESGSPEGSRQVSRQPQRTSLGLPSGSGNHRGDGKGSAPWAGFR